MTLDALIVDSVQAVVVGTSAGGVEALSLLLPALPSSLRVPVLVVIHLPRDRPSLLAEVFAPKCAVPVREIEDKEPIAPGAVYFAPPDYHLLLDKGSGEGPNAALSMDDPVNYSRPSIDVLFESAAEIFGRGLMAVLLTGANEDGAAGLRTVRRAGGLTLAQSPEEAFAAAMPAAAIAQGSVDHVLPLAGIATLFARLGAVR